MAKIVEEILVLKISRLIKEGAKGCEALSADNVNDIEQTVQAIVGDSAIVEVEQA